ncbi:MAG: hypothetical protein ACRDS0_04660 [Pseudonocardiaceae bacterium]
MPRVLTTLGVRLSSNNFPVNRRRLPGIAGLGGQVRDAAAGRGGIHRLLRAAAPFRWRGRALVAQ